MKARIVKTGEIVSVQPGSYIAVLRNGDDAWNGEELQIEDVEILPDGYDEVRTRAAIAAMQGFISTMSDTQILTSIARRAQEDGLATCEWVAQTAVTYADALVKELFNKNNQQL
jgi:hypothetical protein